MCCGIFGLVAPEFGPEEVEQAAALLAHRGPDDAGTYLAPPVALAARRLSIIDLAGGHQPLSNEDGSVWVTYNGELFNAPALRRELQALGHAFRSRADTEVLVHAYEQWGEEALKRLRGMFAFALWDGLRQRLLLARDRFGMKPLYYGAAGGRFAFASEIRPLLVGLPALSRQPDLEALWRLFQLGFIPTPLTAFAGVRKVPAAHYLLYEKGQARLERYWRLAFPPLSGGPAPSPQESAAAFRAQLRQTVDAWRLSDVPVGSLLSGGLDSSALALLLTEVSGGPIATFTIAFAAASHDESAHARQVARFLGSHHHELAFTPADFDHLPQVVAHLEEPQCSATSIPLFLLYRACHQAGFKVIMTGEGADELLGGYHWFDGERRMQSWLGMPAWLRRPLSHLPLPASTAARRVLRAAPRDPVARYALWQQVAGPEQLARLFRQAEPPGLPSWPWQRPVLDGLPPLHQFLLLESETRLADFINFEVDRMSMASSLEARPPFLDHELWQWCAAQPPYLKLSGQGNKLLLRRAMAGRLPAATVQRGKQGLATPHAAWWRSGGGRAPGKMPAWVEEALHPAALAQTGLFRAEEVARLRQAHQRGLADHSRLLTGVLTTQLLLGSTF